MLRYARWRLISRIVTAVLIGLLPLLSRVGFSGERARCPNLVSSVGVGATP